MRGLCVRVNSDLSFVAISTYSARQRTIFASMRRSGPNLSAYSIIQLQIVCKIYSAMCVRTTTTYEAGSHRNAEISTEI